jgi:hypothetical protein
VYFGSVFSKNKFDLFSRRERVDLCTLTPAPSPASGRGEQLRRVGRNSCGSGEQLLREGTNPCERGTTGSREEQLLRQRRNNFACEWQTKKIPSPVNGRGDFIKIKA